MDFGAHDFGGGVGMQESVEGHVTGADAAADVADGLLHYVGLVVTTTNVTFYLDGQVSSSVQLARPVTGI